MIKLNLMKNKYVLAAICVAAICILFAIIITVNPQETASAEVQPVTISENGDDDSIISYENSVSYPSWWNDSSTKQLSADNYADGFYTLERSVYVTGSDITIDDNYSAVDKRYRIKGSGYEAVCEAHIYPQKYTLKGVYINFYCEDGIEGDRDLYVWKPDKEIECFPYTYYISVGNSQYPQIRYLSYPFYMPFRAVDGHSAANNDVQIRITLRVVYVPNSYPLPDEPVKEGYVFTGWYIGTDDDCDGNCTEYNENEIYDDTELHAHFTINKYSVSFDSAGGTSCSTIYTDWNTHITLPTPQKTGYNFLGWYTSNGSKFEDGSAITANMNLTARWEIKTFTVTFYVNGEVYAVKTVEYGTKFAKLIEDVQDENLQCLSVLEGTKEKKISSYLDIPITDDYSVNALKIGIDPTPAMLFIKDYPWIFLVGGVGLSLLIAAISTAGYFAYKHSIETSNRKKR